ncbi:MAG: MBL fold metallo-hydrolase [Candidatus Omnitrophota bacterium]
MIRIKILGSASGIPTKTRFNTSISLVVGGDIYLFDAGEPVSGLLIRNNLDWNKIRAIFISHLHTDHFSGIFQLLQSMQLTLRKNPLYLFMPAKGIESVEKFLKLFAIGPEHLPFKLNLLPVQKGFKDKNLRISAFPTTHFISTHLSESWGFKIEGKKKKILYSGDIGSFNDLNDHLDNLNLLILEFAHFKPEEAFSFFSSRGRKIKKIVITHIHPDLDKTGKEILTPNASLNKRILAGYDGMEIDI